MSAVYKKIHAFLKSTHTREAHKLIMKITLARNPGGDLRAWERDGAAKALFAPRHLDKFTREIFDVAQANSTAPGTHRFALQAQSFMGTRETLPFAISIPGSDDRDFVERAGDRLTDSERLVYAASFAVDCAISKPSSALSAMAAAWVAVIHVREGEIGDKSILKQSIDWDRVRAMHRTFTRTP